MLIHFMNDDYVYSVRMRAAAGGPHEEGGRHVSGAERLVEADEVAAATASLTMRAFAREQETDFVRVTVDRIPRAGVDVALVLRLNLTATQTAEQSIAAATSLLIDEGISEAAAARAFDALMTGEPIRGALLLDTRSGANLTPDGRRGVRASRFDYALTQSKPIDESLAAAGLSHFRTREALALATKVLWSGVSAELCWSDEPDYMAGYVATKGLGYVRFATFKPTDAVGGRVFFVDTNAIDVEKVIVNLERQALWITGPLDIAKFTPPGGAA